MIKVVWQKAASHLDRFSHFCRADDRDRQTDRPRSLCIIIGHIYVRNVLIIVSVSCCDVSVKQKAEFKLVVGDLFYCCLNIWRILPSMLWFAFSDLTLLVGRQEGHPAFKSWVVRYWRGYLSGARCKWFAYGPADGTVTQSSLARV